MFRAIPQGLKPEENTMVQGRHGQIRAPGKAGGLFVSDSFCDVFVRALLRYRDAGAYALHDFVLMPDHFHILLTPARDKTLERVVQYIKGGRRASWRWKRA